MLAAMATKAKKPLPAALRENMQRMKEGKPLQKGPAKKK
jgi:hypothetical protein